MKGPQRKLHGVGAKGDSPTQPESIGIAVCHAHGPLPSFELEGRQKGRGVRACPCVGPEEQIK